MRKIFPASDLARDGRFHRGSIEARVADPRNQAVRDRGQQPGRRPDRPDGPDAGPSAHARHLRG